MQAGADRNLQLVYYKLLHTKHAGLYIHIGNGATNSYIELLIITVASYTILMIMVTYTESILFSYLTQQ